MSYTIDKSGDVIISGWENGIADSPYLGISDIKNLNLISIPKEASVNFATSQISYTSPGTGTMSSSDAGADTITYNSLPLAEGRMAIIFSVLAGASGLSTGTVYYLGAASSTSAQLYTDVQTDASTLVDITGIGTGTFSFVTMTGYPKYFTQDTLNNYWAIDSTGYVWTNLVVTGTNSYWVYAGNTTLTNAHGNGIVAYTTSDGHVYIFVFRNDKIDYALLGTTIAWTYGWKTLKTVSGVNNPHQAIVAPDNKVYYTDSFYIGRWYQADPAVPFLPGTAATFVYDQTQLLPFTDIAQCIAPLGNNLLVGGQKNIIYPWDTFSVLPSFPIFVAESNIKIMVTVNTNCFIFAGNRGRIYYTNGSQAQLYKKIPDHIASSSGTSNSVEPYYQWGGACSNKNQLYFSARVTTNANVDIGTTNEGYGGVWAIDLDTKSIRLNNKLSTNSYLTYSTAMIAQTPYSQTSNPAGTGMYIGWFNTANTTYGIDQTIGTPYIGGQGRIDTDLIPIGTVLQPTTQGQVEFKLAAPIVDGESITLSYRQKFTDGFTAINGAEEGNGSWSIAGTYSGVCQNVDFQQSQWIQFRVTFVSTATNPSYVRLTELRARNG